MKIAPLLSALGFDEFYLEGREPAALGDLAPVRVLSVYGDSYLVTDGKDEMLAEPSGKLLYGLRAEEETPCVGDWALASFYDENSRAILHEVLPRKSLLKRKSAGLSSGVQLIAANVDCAFLMQSLDRDFNPARLERYLVIAREAGVEPIVLFSKADLQAEDEVAALIERTRERIGGGEVIAFSALASEGVEEIRKRMRPGKTYCLLGSSGVGKTTLLNALSGSAFATKPVREKDHRGRHTTTHRELVRLAGGSLLIDNPGMREVGLIDADRGMEETFEDIIAFAEKCKFKDCRHENEKGCAVLEAVQNGELREERLRNYRKLLRETERNDMAYHEKRRKDKEFGKMVKSVMAENKKRKGNR